MRKLALFFLLPFFNLYGQEPKKIVDTTAIILKGFKQVDLLDSLIEKRIFQASYIKTNDSIEKNYLSKVHKDTLIKRLELLNSKTPINIEYNPSYAYCSRYNSSICVLWNTTIIYHSRHLTTHSCC